MQATGAEGLKVTPPDMFHRRRCGKTDDFEAENAAHAAFAELRVSHNVGQ
jgi:hypothetical protein